MSAGLEYARARGAPIEIITELEMAVGDELTSLAFNEPDDSPVSGYLDLMKSGKHYKIGRTNALDRRQYEIAIQLPLKVEPLHSIPTDDPSGIEAYWHNRFKGRRMNGEWFDLTAADVRAFRRRKYR